MKDQHSSWDIRLEHLRVGYGTRVVLDDINAVLPGGKDHGHPWRVRMRQVDLVAARHRAFAAHAGAYPLWGARFVRAP